MDRQRNLQSLASKEFDVCVIGGGITGAGVARDAASRGMKVCLVEQGDFASGTSSRSSKLIHGGIRYLENYEFHLVFEALNERNVLFEIAPHLVHPLNFLLPVYRGGRVGMFKMGLGMWVYDALALMHAPKLHERLDTQGALAHIPQLRSDDLLGAYVYSDAYMDDDRLVLETLRSAERFGAICVNYTRAERVEFDSKKRVTSLAIKDLESGLTQNIKAHHFISSLGPWTDQFGRQVDQQWKSILRPSKGIHFTLERERLPLQEAMVMATGKDNRIIFAIPRRDMVIIGTTDTDFAEDPTGVHTEREDVRYLLQIVDHYLPHAHIRAEDIVASYAGVRPLVHDGASTESKTSREHVILHTPHNVTFVAGGKYTTYRRMARDVMEKVLKAEFSLEDRIAFARNRTREAINPQVTTDRLRAAVRMSPRWARDWRWSEAQAQRFTESYGMEAENILQDCPREYRGDMILCEAWFAIHKTMCRHLRDFMLRRTHMYLAHRDHGLKDIKKIGHVFCHELNWDDARLQKEIDLYREHLRFEMGWTGSTF